MIHLIIKDGLGNQMFQYAFARLLKEEYLKQGQCEHIGIVTDFINSRRDAGNEERKMSLQHLCLCDDVSIIPDEELSKQMWRFRLLAMWSSGISELIRWRLFRVFDSTDALAERRGKYGIYYPYGPYPFHPVTFSKRRDKYVFGFFQNFKYVNSVGDALRSELMVKTAPSDVNKAMIKDISKTTSVCVHIRRGDYLNARWKHLQICDYNYYNNAITKVLEHVFHPVFYIFSNTHRDLKWIAENYHFGQVYPDTGRPIEIRYVDLSNPDYEELRLMYSCQHFIISNSTFSWWAAWLSPNPNKIVCAPDRWNLEYDNDINIYDPSWIKIPR